MKLKQIKLGYEVGTGKEVFIEPAHLVVTGVTQKSGKTTTLEALIKRSGLKAIVFKTKIGERSFTEGKIVPPFFRDRSDYEFVKSLIEAYTKEKMNIEKGTLMTLTKGSKNLIEIKQRVDEGIASGKMRGIKEEIYTRLEHYLGELIPQIQYANFSKVLNIYEGTNIMNLEQFSEEAQSLIIQAVADEVLKTQKGVILVVPEAWKFIPQKYNNPCKRSVESFIRQGAANEDFIWIDSQDMAGVDKSPLKQSSVWILGYQSEINEVEHTLDQIPLPKKSKPKTDDIMTLKKGHFYLATSDGVTKVYVQPIWMEDEIARSIAMGERTLENIEAPDSLVPYEVITKTEQISENHTHSTFEKVPAFDDSKIRRELTELRMDFFTKIQELQEIQRKMATEIFNVKNTVPVQTEIDLNDLIPRIMQKMPMQTNHSQSIDSEKIIQAVIARIPRGGGNIVYEVAPLEKIKKDFLQEAKQKVLDQIKSCDEQQKKIIKWVEQKGTNATRAEIFLNCFGKSATSGNAYTPLNKKVLELKTAELIRMDTSGRVGANLKERIRTLIEQYGATDQEIDQVYNHILSELLN